MIIPTIVGNWKMYTTLEQARSLTLKILRYLTERKIKVTECTIVLCPPFVNLLAVAQEIEGSGIWLGAQNCWTEPYGAFTGEISASMLHAVGCRFVIVGHSERRAIFSEEDALILAKLHRVWETELIPIFCIGETLDQRRQHQTWHVLQNQLDLVLRDSEHGRQWICAYEPVWAIGTGIPASPDEIERAHSFIRQLLDSADCTHVPLLYGGSVSDSNAVEIFGVPNVDGVLVGSASLRPDAFVTIVEHSIASRHV